MASIIENDIERYRAYKENTAEKLRRCLPQEETHYIRHYLAYMEVLGSLENLQKVLFELNHTVQPFCRNSGVIKHSLAKSFRTIKEAEDYGNSLPNNLQYFLVNS